MVGMLGVDEAGGLLTVDLLGKMTVQERIGHIQLVDGPSARDCQLEHRANRARFDNRGEGVGEVHARALPKAADDPTRFVALECAIRSCLELEHPLSTDEVGTWGPRDELPGAVAE